MMTIVYNTYQALMQANDQARGQGHPVGAYDNPRCRHIGWYDHTTRTAHVISMTVLRGEDLIPSEMAKPEGREKLFGGKRVPYDALPVSEVMPQFIQVSDAEGVLFFPEIMVSQTTKDGQVHVARYRLVEE